MSDTDDPAYYRVRQRQARDLANAAVDPHVRRVHLDMAEHHAKLLDGLDPARGTGPSTGDTGRRSDPR